MCTGYKQHMAKGRSSNMTVSPSRNERDNASTTSGVSGPSMHTEQEGPPSAVGVDAEGAPSPASDERGGEGRGEGGGEQPCLAQQALRADLATAPSTWLPHLDMDVDTLEARLQTWTWSDKSVYQRQSQALVSYGSWLVLAGRLDKVVYCGIARVSSLFLFRCMIVYRAQVRSLIKTIQRLNRDWKRLHQQQDERSLWREWAEDDTIAAVQLLAKECYHCEIDLS
jgi:hypothetical protein